MEKERRVKKYALVSLIIAIIGLTVAFAALSQELNISGSGKVDPALWDIYFDNLSEPTINGKASIGEMASIANKTTLNINVNLAVPNDEVIYTVDLVNNGDVNAEIGSIDVSLTEEQKKYVEFGMEYVDTSLGEVEVGDVLLAKTTAPTTLPIKITIKYKDITASELPKENLNIGFTYTLNFVQTSKTEFPSKTTTTSYNTKTFPVVEGQLGDNVYFNYDNGVINITGSGDMWETIPDSDGMCSSEFALSSCSLGVAMAKAVVNELNLSPNVAYKLTLLLSQYLVGITFEDLGTTKDGIRQIMITPESEGGFGFSDEEVNEAMAVIDILPEFKSLVIRNGITSISNNFLAMAKIDHLIIPNTITAIGEDFLVIGKIVNLELEEGTTIVVKNLVSGEDATVDNIILPEGVTTIKTGAINKVRGMTKLTIPKTVTQIETSSISGSDLKKIINKTGRAFDWNGIITGTPGVASPTGTVGSIEITLN